MRFLINVTLAVLVATECYSQQQDAGLRLNLEIEKKVTKRLSVSLINRLTFNNNITECGSAFTGIAAGYKLNKWLTIGGQYRFMQNRNLDNFYDDRQRFIGELSAQKKIGKVEVGIRMRYQSTINGIAITEAYQHQTRDLLRARVQVRYKLSKKYSVALREEIFYRLGQLNNLQGMRTSAAFSYNVTRHHQLDLLYFVHQELNLKANDTDFIFSVGYGFTF
ncbi:MAG: DUF2490 domain-containing protein [Bacteroidetes bacterium]|nr:DUF2490 domain-containing protein [Bacteroidota bacterium]